MTQSLEDYLESIYQISLEKKVTRVKDISEKLCVKKPSVINAMKELMARSYITHEHYGFIELTAEGQRMAKRILNKHNMLKGFLINVVGVSELSAETDACKMEHCLSDETLSKMEKLLRIQRGFRLKGGKK